MLALLLISKKGVENYGGKSFVVHFTKAVDVQRTTWANLSRVQESAIINAAGSKRKIGIGDVGKVRDSIGFKGNHIKSKDDNN